MFSVHAQRATQTNRVTWSVLNIQSTNNCLCIAREGSLVVPAMRHDHSSKILDEFRMGHGSEFTASKVARQCHVELCVPVQKNDSVHLKTSGGHFTLHASGQHADVFTKLVLTLDHFVFGGVWTGLETRPTKMQSYRLSSDDVAPARVQRR